MNQTKLVSSKELQSEISSHRRAANARPIGAAVVSRTFQAGEGKFEFCAAAGSSDRNQAQMQAMREQLQAVEEQVSFYQEQIADRDAEVYQLRQSVQESTDRSRMLEKWFRNCRGFTARSLPSGSSH